VTDRLKGAQRAGYVWLAALLVAGALALVFGREFWDIASFKTLGLNYGAIKTWVDANPVCAAAAYVVTYVVVAVLLIPGSLILAVSSGLLFGPVIGVLLCVAASTLGAVTVFALARSAVGGALRAKAGPWFAKLEAGFNAHALGYILFLRLVPTVPFPVVNIVCAMLGMRMTTFALGTLVGSLPVKIALSTAGVGLANLLETQNAAYSSCLAGAGSHSVPCGYQIDAASLLTPQMLAAFVALAVLALVPAVTQAVPFFKRRFSSEKNIDV
jgi:uncharacterized membrane protein YdjX (TVP38/TMEM64 family)